jgi:hypothetical protein
MKIPHEKEAANAYLKFLQTKGAATGTLYKRSVFLDKLTAILADKALGRTEYGQALDATMKTSPTSDKHDCLNTAREFYPFWVNDIKAIAAFQLHYGFDIQTIQWKPLPASLKSLTDNLDTEKFSRQENLTLDAYSRALYEAGAEKSLVDSRIKLAKIILIRLRDAPIENNKSYRMAVDIILPLFNINEIKQLFLIVVREFYYFWTGDSDAPSKISRNQQT